ncbi:MAG: cpaB [Rhodospirillales bacterium]|nr:cpaB [Rhodospirillales bacterium]
MRLPALIFAALAVILGLGTATFARYRMSEARKQVAVQSQDMHGPVAYVLVADKDLPAGTLLHDSDLRWQSWPDDQLSDAYLRKDRDDAHALDGGVVRLRIAKGEPVGAGRVVKPGERGFLAAVLSPGTRATSVLLTATSDVAGLILPGDHVDLILSHPIANERQPNAPARLAAETVLSDLRVVAIDQSINDQDKKPLSGKTATFEVTPKQAEIIEVAKLLGNLSLVLRSAGADPADKDGAERVAGPTHTWDSEVSPLMHHQEPGAIVNVVVTILRGDGKDGGTGVASAASAATIGGGNTGAAGAKGVANGAMMPPGRGGS